MGQTRGYPLVGCLDDINRRVEDESETSLLIGRQAEDQVRGQEAKTGPPMAGGPFLAVAAVQVPASACSSVVQQEGVPGEGTPVLYPRTSGYTLGTRVHGYLGLGYASASVPVLLNLVLS